jgi:hypothetical protein
VREFLGARARADWARACTYLTAVQRRELGRLIRGGDGISACAKAMRRLAVGVSADAFDHEAEIRRVLSLRVGARRAFLIYTRPRGKVYVTALRHEGGAWKVISVGPTVLD